MKHYCPRQYLVPAVDLLSRHGRHLPVPEVVKMVPEGWSLSLLGRYLGAATRAAEHRVSASV